VLPRYRELRREAFAARESLTVGEKLMMALGMACLTGLMALIRIPLPFTPVPFTGQVFAVLLAGALCGRKWGAISQVLYVGMGAAGVPWFQSFGVGFGHLTGLTGGYLIGFVVAAWYVGYLCDRDASARSFHSLLGIMLVGVGIILSMGSLWLAGVLGMGLGKAFAVGAAPFVAGGIGKALLAAGVASALMPKTKFGPETD
jgi:biotin transport system substrate-specific component